MKFDKKMKGTGKDKQLSKADAQDKKKSSRSIKS